jgi:hypothetical protein
MRTRIANQYWDVRLATNLGENDGYCDYGRKHIRLQKALRGDAMLETAIHETLHVEFPQLNEETITAAAKSVVKVLKLKPVWERITDG